MCEQNPTQFGFRAGETAIFVVCNLPFISLFFFYFCRLEYTRQDNSKKQEMGVDGPSPDLRVRLSVIFTLTNMSLDRSSAVKTLLGTDH